MHDQRTYVAVARVNGSATDAQISLDDCDQRGPAVVRMDTSLRLDFDDTVAAVYLWITASCDGQRRALAHVTDAPALREALVLAVLDRGLECIANQRDLISDRPSGADWVLDEIRARVHRLLAPGPAPTGARPAALALAGVR
jgi:hypothetical protein